MNFLRDAYLRIDLRQLAVFRIYFGFLLLGDLAYHASQATLFYSNVGILPNHRILFAPQADRQFSLLSALSTPGEVKLGFALIAVVYLLYLVGWRTRWMQVLSLICVSSVDARNLFAEDGGCVTVNLLAAWTMLLPLGEHFSVDSLVRRARQRAQEQNEQRYQPRDQPRDQPRGEDGPVAAAGSTVHDPTRAVLGDIEPVTVVSFAVVGILVQAAGIYLLNALHKSGPSWMTGESFHQILWQNRCNTALAGWLRWHEPGWLSPVMTKATLLIEINLPVLILFPVARRVCRSVAFVIAVCFHTGIAMIMTLGTFSYAMIGLMMLVIPHEVIAVAASRLSSTSLATWMDRTSERMVSWLVTQGRSELSTTSSRLIPPRVSLLLRESMAVLFLVVCVNEALHENAAIPIWMRPRHVAFLDALSHYPRLMQGWRMFAPDTPTLDGIVVIDAVTVSGRHVDPFTGQAPDLEILERGPYPHPILIADFLFMLGADQNAWARDEVRRYVMAWNDSPKRDAQDRIERFDAYMLLNDAPDRGSTQIQNVRKEILFSGP